MRRSITAADCFRYGLPQVTCDERLPLMGSVRLKPGPHTMQTSEPLS